MNRTFQLTTLNHPTLKLKQPLNFTLEQTSDGAFASLVDAPAIRGLGGNGNEAMAALADALTGAFTVGDQTAAQFVYEQLAAPQAPVAAAAPPATAEQPTNGVVYVLIKRTEDENHGIASIQGVTSNKEWAIRWKEWGYLSDYVAVPLEKLP